MNRLYKLQLLYRLKALGHQWFDDRAIVSTPNPYKPLVHSSHDRAKSIRHCALCELSKARLHPLIPQWVEHSPVLLLSDMPSPTENETGQFFVGQGGTLLATILKNVLNFETSSVSITTLLKCRPRVHATAHSYMACRYYWESELNEFQGLIIVLGDDVSSHLGLSEPFHELRGKVLSYGDNRMVVTYSPLQIIRNPSLKKEAYHDWLLIKSILEQKNDV